VEVSNQARSRVKLVPNWQGPYRVAKVAWDKTYCLRTTEGVMLSRTCHIVNLKKFYP
ncbi:hypothetical protein B296_00013572, partial [Ensete ventricosum]